jgi:hypothetical protein
VEEDPYDCTVFAEDPSRDRHAFIEWVRREVDERLGLYHSHDRDPIAAREFPSGFLRFRYQIEVADGRDVAPRLLRCLWDNGIPAVASCDFEDEMPENGGYKSRNVPWPRELPPFDCTLEARDRTRTQWHLRDWLERELGEPVLVVETGKPHRYRIDYPEALTDRLLRVLRDDGIRVSGGGP